MKQPIIYRIVIALIVLFGTIQVQAQSFEEILEATLQKTKSLDSYEVTTEYKMYRGLDDPKVYEGYKGKLIQNGTRLYQQLGAMEYVQSDSFYVKLNHDDKEILIGNLEEAQTPQLSNFDLASILGHFEKDKLSSEGNYHKIELIGKDRNPLQIAKLDLYIDKESMLLMKQSMIFSRLNDFSVYENKPSPQDLDVARLEITYSNYSDTIDDEKLTQERYFAQHGETVVLSKEFSDFELIPSK